MKITTAEAEAFFAHPSQRGAAMLDGPLPDWMDYYADGGVCGAFHWLQDGVLMGHLGVIPDMWGGTIRPAKTVLAEAWADQEPARIVGWIKQENRAACRWVERLGFTLDGQLPLPDPVLMFGWRP